MLELISVALILLGGAIFFQAFKPGYKKVAPIVVGTLLMAAGFYILPTPKDDQPEVYYRK